jgi:hypothetical protein
VVMHRSVAFVWDTYSVLELGQVENMHGRVGGGLSWPLAPLPCHIAHLHSVNSTDKQQNMRYWMVARLQGGTRAKQRWKVTVWQVNSQRICVHSFPDPTLEVSVWGYRVFELSCWNWLFAELLNMWCLWYITLIWIWRWWWSQPIGQ